MQKKKAATIKNNLFFLKLVWKICPSRVVLNFLYQFFSFGIWTFYSVVFMQYLFRSGEQSRSFGEVAGFIWFAVLLGLTAKAYNAWYEDCFVPKTDIRIHYHLNVMLFDKAETVDLSCYENPEFYNTYTKAATEASDRAKTVLNNCAMLVSALLSSLFVSVTLFQITPWSMVLILFPVVGNLWIGKKEGNLAFTINEEATPSKRRMDYVNRVMYFRKYAAEVRLTKVFDVLRRMYRNAMQERIDIDRKYAFRKTYLHILFSMLMFIIPFHGTWFFGAVLGSTGKISLSDMVVLLNAIVSVAWMLNDLETALAGIFSDAFFIENVKSFLYYEPKIDESLPGLMPPEQVDTIEFRNVSFRYPGQERDTLQNINLTFHRGIRHALVGINGSGKSTLIKLILRFYDPTEGEILLNGVNIKEYHIQEYRRSIGVAFQDFALFAATVTENVLLREEEYSDMVSEKGQSGEIYDMVSEEGQNDAEQDKFSVDRQQVICALKNSDVYGKIQTLPHQEDTILTKEFDDEGAELSGGERQKIAIARAFAKNSPVVILDEPSSALDPIAEYMMFETITELCRGENKLSVIVSHRLSSAAVCEQIFVLEKGKLVEQGSHAELLATDGIYANMFRKQARNYQVEEVELHG